MKEDSEVYSINSEYNKKSQIFGHYSPQSLMTTNKSKRKLLRARNKFDTSTNPRIEKNRDNPGSIKNSMHQMNSYLSNMV